MTSPPTLRTTSDGDELVFSDYHATVHDGDYRFVATSSLAPDPGDPLFSGTSSITIRVSGPQTSLPQGSVVSTYPAGKSSGPYHAVLPHVVLARGSMPWERSPYAGSITESTAPWMVVVILNPAELAMCAVHTVTAGDLGRPIDGAADDPVVVLDLPQSLVTALLPPRRDLPWLAHVRTLRSSRSPNDAGPETATVLSARLPARGAENHAFLLSVDKAYDGEVITVKDGATRRFVVLHQWAFFCRDEGPHGFVDQLSDASDPPAAFALAADPNDSRDASARRAAGFVPLEYRLRNGEVSAAWYHGPLVPGRPVIEPGVIGSRLPAEHADELLVLDEAFAVFDVSYAAAWQLGRMMVLQHTDVATAILRWKHELARMASPAPSASAAHPTSVAASVAASRTASVLPPLPQVVAEFIDGPVLRLRDVPFRYLVPDEGLLTTSSCRFFDVDAGWLECLRDGVLSVGRADAAAASVETYVRGTLDAPEEMSGMLLRSGAVADFPNLHVQGYDTPPEGPSYEGTPLQVLRMERLSPSTLLVLFRGRVKAVDVHLHPQAVHFGFAEQGPPGDVGVNSLRRIDMCDLAAHVLGSTPEKAAKPAAGDVARFASLMLAGTPRVRFARALADEPSDRDHAPDGHPPATEGMP